MSFRFTPGCCCQKPLDCFVPCIPDCQILYEGTGRIDDDYEVDFSLVLADNEPVQFASGDCVDCAVDKVSAYQRAFYSTYKPERLGLFRIYKVLYSTIGTNAFGNPEDFDEKIYVKDIPNAGSNDTNPPQYYNNGVTTWYSSYFRRLSYDGLIHATARGGTIFGKRVNHPVWFSYGIVVVLPYDYEKEPFCLPGTKTDYGNGMAAYNVQSVSLTEVEDVRERFKNPEDCGFEFPLEADTSYVENPGVLFPAKDLMPKLRGMVSDDRVPALDEVFIKLYGIYFAKRTWNRDKKRWEGGTWEFREEKRSVTFARVKKEEPEESGEEENSQSGEEDEKAYTTELVVIENKTLTDIEITDENYDPDFNTPGHPDFPGDYLLNCYDDHSTATNAPEGDFCESREVFGTGDCSSDTTDSVGTPAELPNKWVIGTADPLNDNSERFRGRYWLYAELAVPWGEDFPHQMTSGSINVFLGKFSINLGGGYFTGLPGPDEDDSMSRYFKCSASLEATASDYDYESLTRRRFLDPNYISGLNNNVISAAVQDGTIYEKYGSSIWNILGLQYISAPAGKRLEKIVWFAKKLNLGFWNPSSDMPTSASDLSTAGPLSFSTCGKLRSVSDLEDNNMTTYPKCPRGYTYTGHGFSFFTPYNETGVWMGSANFDYPENWTEIQNQLKEDYHLNECQKTVNGNGFKEFIVDGSYKYLITMTETQVRHYMSNNGNFHVMNNDAWWNPRGREYIRKIDNNQWLDSEGGIDGYAAISGVQYIAIWKDAES
jgi:hypothetical protein